MLSLLLFVFMATIKTNAATTVMAAWQNKGLHCGGHENVSWGWGPSAGWGGLSPNPAVSYRDGSRVLTGLYPYWPGMTYGDYDGDGSGSLQGQLRYPHSTWYALNTIQIPCCYEIHSGNLVNYTDITVTYAVNGQREYWTDDGDAYHTYTVGSTSYTDHVRSGSYETVMPAFMIYYIVDASNNNILYSATCEDSWNPWWDPYNGSFDRDFNKKTKTISLTDAKYQGKTLKLIVKCWGNNWNSSNPRNAYYFAATGNAHTHTSDTGTVTKAATCTATGIKTYKCKTCGAVLKTETISALGHSYSGAYTVTATNYTQKCGNNCGTTMRSGSFATPSNKTIVRGNNTFSSGTTNSVGTLPSVAYTWYVKKNGSWVAASTDSRFKNYSTATLTFDAQYYDTSVTAVKCYHKIGAVGQYSNEATLTWNATSLASFKPVFTGNLSFLT